MHTNTIELPIGALAGPDLFDRAREQEREREIEELLNKMEQERIAHRRRSRVQTARTPIEFVI